MEVGLDRLESWADWGKDGGKENPQRRQRQRGGMWSELPQRRLAPTGGQSQFELLIGQWWLTRAVNRPVPCTKNSVDLMLLPFITRGNCLKFEACLVEPLSGSALTRPSNSVKAFVAQPISGSCRRALDVGTNDLVKVKSKKVAGCFLVDCSFVCVWRLRGVLFRASRRVESGSRLSRRQRHVLQRERECV